MNEHSQSHCVRDALVYFAAGSSGAWPGELIRPLPIPSPRGCGAGTPLLMSRLQGRVHAPHHHAEPIRELFG